MGGEVMAAAWGLLGTAVGALASIGTTWLTNAHAAKLEDSKSKAMRAEVAREFQRKTLLELQEATLMLTRLVTKAHLHDRKALSAGEQWRSVRLPDELSNEVSDAFRQVTLLTQRVSNETLRARLKKFTDDAGSCLQAPDPEAGTTFWQHLVGTEFTTVIESLCEVLRQNYEST
jgi:hypothetical protein